MSGETHYFNGIDALTGDPAFAAMGEEELVDALFECGAEDGFLREVEKAAAGLPVRRHDPGEGVDARDLSETGWGVIYAESTPREVIQALEDLREHRLEQIGGYGKQHLWREFYHRPGMTAAKFLRGEGISLAETADPKDMPYYILLVGGPEEIPFPFQYELSQQYGVGRLYFEDEKGAHDPERYKNYVNNVIAAEAYEAPYPRRAAFFGAINHGDRASRATAHDLVGTLAEKLATDRKGWSVESHLGPDATKSHFAGMFNNGERPGVLFASGHGLFFSDDNDLVNEKKSREFQGSLICSTGPETDKRAYKDYVYTARDLADEGIDLSGLIACFFSCYSAGTPANDDFRKKNVTYRGDMRRPFIAKLPQAMLGREKGALAVMGHVERTWTSSFRGADSELQVQTFSNALKRLLDGKPVGNALGRFTMRHSHLALWLRGLEMMNQDLQREGGALPPQERSLYARLWKNDRDVRNFIVLGDPAVRINLEEW